MATLNPGYYNNTTCSTGGVQMPNSDLDPITLTPVCNPIDQQLINTIISYLISNDIFILNQSTDTQQDPGQFNIVSYGQAYNFRSVLFNLLDTSIPRVSQQQLKLENININSLGQYYSAQWTTETDTDYAIIAENILLKGQPVLYIDALPTTELDYLLSADGNGIVNRVVQTNVQTKIPTLQQVCSEGNSTTTTISQQDAVNNSDLVTYGQMIDHIADIISSSPEVLTIINELINQVTNNDPIVQTILDALADYIPLTQKGAQNGVQTLDLTSHLTPSQWPAMTLQDICDNGQVTTTTIIAAPASLNTELVTLGQVNSLLNAGVGTLHDVLTQGNTSTLSILLNNLDTSTIYGPDSVVVHYSDGDDDRSLSIGSSTIDFHYAGATFDNNVSLRSSIDSDSLPDRLVMANLTDSYIVTSNDFGHNPSTNLSINADKLDGYHASEFVLLEDYPFNFAGAALGYVLTYNGTNWVPSEITTSQVVELSYFKESVESSFAIWQPKDSANSMFLKTTLYKNLQLGSAIGSITGLSNLVYSYGSSGPTISGNNNVIFAQSGNIVGSSNYVFSTAATLTSLSTSNFVVNTTSTLGTTIGAIANIIMMSETDATSTYGFAGSNNTMLQNSSSKFNQTSISNSFLQNNITVSIGQDDIVSIGSYTTTLSNKYQTAINAYNCTIAGERSFVSGYHITTASYANVAFGIYPTVESNVGSTTQVNVTDRSFFVGAGTNVTPYNSITIWKSGETQIGGALQLGYSDGTKNETGQAITGMIRQNSGYLEIYRGGWTNVLSTQTFTWDADPAWSIIKYKSTDTPSTYSVTGSTDAWNNDYKIRPGVLSTLTQKNAVSLTINGLMTFLYSGVFNVNINLRLTITNVTAGDRIQIEAVMNGETTYMPYMVTQNLYEQTSDVSVNFSFTEHFVSTDTMQLYIHYKSGVSQHDVTPNILGTSVTISEVSGANLST